jgi:uncharacterized protein (DUF2147 family)
MSLRGTLISACVVALVSVLAVHSTATADEGAFGYWKATDKETGKTLSIFRVWEDKGKVVGKIVKQFPKPNGDKAQELCTECSGAQKDKPVLGMIFLWGLEKDGENANKWVSGKVLNPEDGKTYNAEITYSPQEKTMTIYGYIKMLVKLGGSNVWKRPTPEEMKGIQTGS